MHIDTEQSTLLERRMGLALIAAAVLCLVAAGSLLWRHYGGAIFSDMVVTTLAWCF